MQHLDGSNAIVTGASRGLGAHIARALAAEGVNLVLAARSGADLESVRTSLGGSVRTVTVACDVTVADGRAELVERAAADLGPVDILVNNAGAETVGSYEVMPVTDIERSVALNLLAPMLLTRAVLPGMIQRGRGHIVNIASVAGRAGSPYDAPYGATKAGLIGFTKSLRDELADGPVGVSAICPGFVRDEGIYAREEAEGVRAPRVMGTTSPDRVARAVVAAISGNRGDLIVNRPPLRPLFALAVAFPDVEAPLERLLGVTGMMRQVSRLRGRG